MQFGQESKVSLGRGFFLLCFGVVFSPFQFLTKGLSPACDKRCDLTFSVPFFASLLALKKDEAVIILCYAILEGNCLSSVVTQAWKEVEERVLGFGDSVKMLASTVDPRCVQGSLQC